MKDAQALEVALTNFFQDKDKKALCIIHNLNLDIHATLTLKLKKMTLGIFYYFDTSQSYVISSSLEVIPQDKQTVFIFDFRENNDLENVYTKYDLSQWKAKCIIICPQRLLHPTLDSSIYFAPIDNGKVQGRLLSRAVLSPPRFSPDFSAEGPLTTTSIPVSKNPSLSPGEFYNHFLNQKLMTNNPLMMQLLADKIFEDDEFKNFLFKLIYASRHDEKMQIAAANAITALNYARVSFSGMDLSNIRIQSADLRGAVLHCTNLTQADLRNVRLQNSYLMGTIFHGCDMTGISFDQFPYLVHKASSVLSVAFSPKKDWFAAGGTDTVINIWRIDKNYFYPYRLLQGHTDWIDCVTFDGNGQLLASASRDKTVRLWQVEEGKLLQVFHGHTDWVRSVAIGSNNKRLASGSADTTVRVWSLETAELLHILKHIDWVSSVAFSGDSELLVSGSRKGTVFLWQVSDGILLRTFSGHTAWTNCVAFSTDNKWIASAGEDKTVYLWWVNDGSIRAQFTGHKSAITSIALSCDNQLLAVCTDYTVWLWRIEDSKVERVIYGQSYYGQIKGVWSVAFNVNDRLLATGNSDSTIRLWPLTTDSNQLIHYEIALNEIESLAFSLNNQWLASGSWDGTVRFWHLAHGGSYTILEGRNGRVITVNYQKNNEIVFICSGTMKPPHSKVTSPKFFSYSLVNQSEPKVIEFYNLSFIYLAVISSDGEWIATVSKEYQQKIMIWRREGMTLKLLHSIDAHTLWITCLAISSDNRLLASCSIDKTIKMWVRENGILLHTFTADNEWVNCIAFSFDCQWLVSGNFSNSISIYKVRDGSLCRRLEETNVNLSNLHRIWISRIAVSYDNRYIASGNNLGQLQLWSMQDGNLLQTLELFSGITRIIFSYNNQWIAVGCIDKAIRIFSLVCEKNSISAHLRWISHSRLVAERADMREVRGITASDAELLEQHDAVNVPKMQHLLHLTALFQPPSSAASQRKLRENKFMMKRVLRWVYPDEPEPGIRQITFDGAIWRESYATGYVKTFQPMKENETIVAENIENETYRNTGSIIREMDNKKFDLFIPDEGSEKMWLLYRHSEQHWQFMCRAEEITVSSQKNLLTRN